jgi:hypothetical protein
MGVLLQGFFRKLANNAVPRSADGDALIPWWWDHWASQATALCQAGFAAIRLRRQQRGLIHPSRLESSP